MNYLIVILTAGLIFAALVQLFFWGKWFTKLGDYKKDESIVSKDEDLPSVSVIICARNEAENLRQNLSFFLEQDYPNFELIVVNDGSTDKTLEILLEFQKKYPILRMLSTQGDTPPGKKAALNLGIQRASFEWLFLSDADCRPSSPQWLRLMQRSFLQGTSIIIGYGPYRKMNGFLNKFIRFEAFYTAIQYFSFSLAGYPYMGVGRNLAYRRQVFQQAEGFSSHNHLMSGDDDLFVNQMATANNTTINILPDARIYSTPVSSWGSYYIQKRRHLSVSSHYRFKHQLALGLLSFSHFTFYVSLLVLVILMPSWWFYLTLTYLVRMGVVLRACAKISKHLGEQDLLVYLPLLDLAFLSYYLIFAPTLLTGSRIHKWK